MAQALDNVLPIRPQAEQDNWDNLRETRLSLLHQVAEEAAKEFKFAAHQMTRHEDNRLLPSHLEALSHDHHCPQAARAAFASLSHIDRGWSCDRGWNYTDIKQLADLTTPDKNKQQDYINHLNANERLSIAGITVAGAIAGVALVANKWTKLGVTVMGLAGLSMGLQTFCPHDNAEWYYKQRNHLAGNSNLGKIRKLIGQ